MGRAALQHSCLRIPGTEGSLEGCSPRGRKEPDTTENDLAPSTHAP